MKSVTFKSKSGERSTKVLASTTTIAEVLSEFGASTDDPSVTYHIEGDPVRNGDFNKTLSDFTAADEVYIIAVGHKDNA